MVASRGAADKKRGRSATGECASPCVVLARRAGSVTQGARRQTGPVPPSPALTARGPLARLGPVPTGASPFTTTRTGGRDEHRHEHVLAFDIAPRVVARLAVHLARRRRSRRDRASGEPAGFALRGSLARHLRPCVAG